MTNSTELATFGSGCFWSAEEVFMNIPGVISTQVGYMGGTTKHPTYQEVCTDRTGHAEVVEITYDPQKINYQHLLKVFFDSHDPTSLNRQGADIGRQYRSVIFYHTPEQQKTAERYISDLAKSGKYQRAIITEIVPNMIFYRAEEYHQHYFKKQNRTKLDN